MGKNKWLSVLITAVTLGLAAGAGTAAAADADWLTPQEIKASSQLHEAGYSYDPWYVYDQDPVSAWVEGSGGYGTGEYLEFSFPAGTVLTGGIVSPGFCKNGDLFDKNSAPSSLLISSGSMSVTLDVSTYAASYSASSSGYLFTLPQPLTCDGVVRVTIQDVREGWKYADTVISEMRFQGYDGSAAGTAASGGTESGSTASGGTDAASAQPVKSIEEMTDEDRDTLKGIAYWAYRHHSGFGTSQAENSALTAEDLSAEDKAFVLYWFQYFQKDKRIYRSSSPEYNEARKTDLAEIMDEIYGPGQEEAMQVFWSDYVISGDDSIVRMNGTGDFGDAGGYYFDQCSMEMTDDGRLKLVGDVQQYNYETSGYHSDKKYVVFFRVSQPGVLGQYQFDSVQVF